MRAIAMGLIAVFVYGVLVGAKSLIGMFRYDKSCWPLAFGYLAYFLLMPLTFFIPGLYPSLADADYTQHSLWKVCLLLLLACVWLILGFFIKASYQRIITGEYYWKPRDVALKRIFIGTVAAAVGGVVWLCGLMGMLGFLTGWWEKSAIILSLYLIFQGLVLIVRNIKYLGDKPKERIKTATDKTPKKDRKKSNKPEYQHISYKGQKKKKQLPPAGQ